MGMIVISVVFALSFWLGVYLLARSSAALTLRLAGAGMVAYAFAVVLMDYSTWSLTWIIVTAICWMIAVGLELRTQRTRDTPKHPMHLLIVGAIFFGLSVWAFLMPFIPFPRPWLLLIMGCDVVLLGLAIAYLDAFDAGEMLWSDLLRSFAGSALACLVFGGLMGLAGGADIWVLLVCACAILFEVFATRWQTWLDQLVFVRQPKLQAAREELREVAQALPRAAQSDIFDPSQVDEDEFIRLTRRAISALGDLPKLTTSPLTRLPIIEARLSQHGQPNNPIERATLLKQALTESILSLKPSQASGNGTASGFGSADDWRHFNALYYPYVIGLKPYSVRVEHHQLSADAQAALAWFRSQVPERTLYNWQTAAAKLVAQRLRA